MPSLKKKGSVAYSTLSRTIAIFLVPQCTYPPECAPLLTPPRCGRRSPSSSPWLRQPRPRQVLIEGVGGCCSERRRWAEVSLLPAPVRPIFILFFEPNPDKRRAPCPLPSLFPTPHTLQLLDLDMLATPRAALDRLEKVRETGGEDSAREPASHALPTFGGQINRPGKLPPPRRRCGESSHKRGCAR